MDDITSLSAFDRMKDAAEGAKAKLSAALDDLPAPSSGGLSTMALPALAVGATAAGVGTVTALALAKESKPRKKASRKKKAARKPMKRKAKAKGKVRRKSKHSHAREDRSGRVVTKKTYRGKKVHWTKNGQPYVYQADGRPRFIKR